MQHVEQRGAMHRYAVNALAQRIVTHVEHLAPPVLQTPVETLQPGAASCQFIRKTKRREGGLACRLDNEAGSDRCGFGRFVEYSDAKPCESQKRSGRQARDPRACNSDVEPFENSVRPILSPAAAT